MTYSLTIGIWKTIKNGLIWFGPAILAFLGAVPLQYAGIASVIIYLFKNWYENHKEDPKVPDVI